MNKLLNRCCPLCKSENVKKLEKLSKDNWEIVKCVECGFVFLKNPPTYESLQNSFEWYESRNKERGNRRNNRKFYYLVSDSLKKIKGFIRNHQRKEHLIIKKLNKSGNFLDVGCADGGTLKGLSDKFIPFGVEISPILSEKANKFCNLKGGEVKNADAISGIKSFNKSFFDVILMRSYLEHEINPLEVLKESAKVLKSNGILIIKVPNFNSINRKIRGIGWPGFRFPDHVNYFSPNTLEKMINLSGLRILKFNFFDKIITSDNMWLLAMKNQNEDEI